MKKGLIIATALIGITGGVALGQTALFSSAQNEEFLTAAAAKKIALQQFNGTVIEYDFDRDDRTPHYEFEIKNDAEEVEVEVNAINGEAKITERKSLKGQSAAIENTTNQSSQEAQQQMSASVISKSQAIAIAQAQAAGTVTKAKLDDDDDGIQVYEIEIKDGNTEYEFEIDAMTGQVLEIDADYDDDDN